MISVTIEVILNNNLSTGLDASVKLPGASPDW